MASCVMTFSYVTGRNIASLYFHLSDHHARSVARSRTRVICHIVPRCFLRPRGSRLFPTLTKLHVTKPEHPVSAIYASISRFSGEQSVDSLSLSLSLESMDPSATIIAFFIFIPVNETEASAEERKKKRQGEGG